MSDRIHELKTWPEPFQAMLDGAKTFEYRRDDRGYMGTDVLRLREWDPGLGTVGAYTGRVIERRVTYVLHGGRFGVPEGYCVMSLESTDADHKPSPCCSHNCTAEPFWHDAAGYSFCREHMVAEEKALAVEAAAAPLRARISELEAACEHKETELRQEFQRTGDIALDRDTARARISELEAEAEGLRGRLAKADHYKAYPLTMAVLADAGFNQSLLLSRVEAAVERISELEAEAEGLRNAEPIQNASIRQALNQVKAPPHMFFDGRIVALARERDTARAQLEAERGKREEAKRIVDDIARALHPHWGDTTGNGYLPEQLAGMVERLREKASESDAEAKRLGEELQAFVKSVFAATKGEEERKAGPLNQLIAVSKVVRLHERLRESDRQREELQRHYAGLQRIIASAEGLAVKNALLNAEARSKLCAVAPVLEAVQQSRNNLPAGWKPEHGVMWGGERMVVTAHEIAVWAAHDALNALPTPEPRDQGDADAEAEWARLEAMTDAEVIAEAEARGVDVAAEAEKTRALLLEAARKAIAAKDRLMADPGKYRDQGAKEGLSDDELRALHLKPLKETT